MNAEALGLLRSMTPSRLKRPQRFTLGNELACGEQQRPLERLKTALSILIGTEAFFAMRDVVGLDHDQARARGEWAVRQMVRATR